MGRRDIICLFGLDRNLLSPTSPNSISMNLRIKSRTAYLKHSNIFHLDQHISAAPIIYHARRKARDILCSNSKIHANKMLLYHWLRN